MSSYHPAILGGTPRFSQSVPLVRPHLPDFSQLEAETLEILRTGRLTHGPFLQKFEAAAAQHLGVKHAIAVSSCTAGLILVCQHLQLRGEVIVPSFTFMATASAVVWVGCKPVFVDVDPETTNISVERIAEAITPQTTAILAVHNFGNPAPCDALVALAQRHRLRLLFDAAHGWGSLYQGQPLGIHGDAQCFSLSPTKLVTGGEGGIVATQDDALAQAIRIGREYGNPGNYDCLFPGLNARMPEFNAILARHSLAMLEEAVAERNHWAHYLKQRLQDIPGISCQKIEPGNRSSYKDFSITIDPERFGLERDEVRAILRAEGIDTRAYYDPPVHQQSAFQAFSGSVALTHTNTLARHSLSLPIWSRMPREIPIGICDVLEDIANHADILRSQLRSTQRVRP